jgi:hypothetical protein
MHGPKLFFAAETTAVGATSPKHAVSPPLRSLILHYRAMRRIGLDVSSTEHNSRADSAQIRIGSSIVFFVTEDPSISEGGHPCPGRNP